MGFKCSVSGCKSGYDSQTTDENVTFHTYPTNPEMRQKWIRANPRKDFLPTKHSRVCSLHFLPSDFTYVRSDTNKNRLKTVSQKLQRRRLKDDSVPSEFTNVPRYLSKLARTPRSTKKATSGSRRQQAARKLQDLEECFQASDDVLLYRSPCTVWP